MCACVRACVCARACVHTHTRTRMHVCVHACVRVCVCVYKGGGKGMLPRHLCVLRVFLMSGTLVFLLVYEMCDVSLARCARSVLSLRHFSRHSFLDIPMFASVCLTVCCTRLGLS